MDKNGYNHINKSERNSQLIISIDHIVGAFFGAITGILMMFPNLVIGPVGLPIISFLLIVGFAVLSVLAHGSKVYINAKLWNLLLHYFVFVIVFGSMFILAGSVENADIHYIISTATNITWILFIVIFTKKIPITFKTFILFCTLSFASGTIAMWCFGFIRSSDPFFMRFGRFQTGIWKLSIFKNPNGLARAAGTILPLLYYFYIKRKIQRKNSFIIPVLLLLLSLIILFTLSRANFLALIIFIIGALSYHRLFYGKTRTIKWKRIFLTTMSIIIFAMILSTTVQERVLSIYQMAQKTWNIAKGIDSRHLPMRIRTWYATINIINEKPFTGVGLSKIEQYQEKYGGVKYLAKGETHSSAVHSGFLKIAAYGGLTSFFFFIIFYYKYLKFAKRIFRRTLPNSLNYLSAYCLYLLLIMLIPMNIGADSFGDPFTWLVVGILTSLSCMTYCKHDLRY